MTVDGEIRSTAIILEPNGRATVLNEPGPPLADEDWMAYEAADRRGIGRARRARLLRQPAARGARGRLRPAGARARTPSGCPAVVDASGPALRAALGHGVDVVTPNLGEAEGLLHGRADESVEASPDARPRSEAAALALVDAGARAAIVTAAAAGAAVAVGE